MMDLTILFITHFLFDFVFQSREMGKRKSEDINYLLKHGGILFMGYMWAAYAICDNIADMFAMGAVIVIIHCIQDWYIWRGYKWIINREIIKCIAGADMIPQEHLDAIKTKELNNFKYWEDHKFYTTIGIDQTLHFITIVLLYDWVM